MPNILNILIASDHKASREALTRILNKQPFFHVIAVCADTFAAITMTHNAAPDIVIIDGGTDPLAAIEATKKITACSTANIIGISRSADTAFAQHMLAAGALGYLTSQSPETEIIVAVEEVAKDNLYSCLDLQHIPIATPERFSTIKKSMAGIANDTRNKISQAVESQWHAILKFTN